MASNFGSMTIKQLIEDIGKNKVYLPAIQRGFVWKSEQIEKLFDSIMRGYPIGTFLFWFVESPEINNYVFYKFLQDFHQRDKHLFDKAPHPEIKDEIIGVLDGQQRLCSMYIALQGTYAVKKKWAKSDALDAFPKKELYFNILSDVMKDEDEEINYSFKFLTEQEASTKTETQFWFKVKEIIEWDNEKPPIFDIFFQLIDSVDDHVKVSLQKKRNEIMQDLTLLHSKISKDELINFFKIDNKKSLDDVLPIFIRVNSGGTFLSKTDLLFSTIIATWEQGREEIEDCIKEINKKGEGFKFSNDFIMRSCLVLSDLDVLFKVNNFGRENVEKIKEKWNNIKDSLYKTVDLLVDWGISDKTLSSYNSIIPIAYYLSKKGIINPKTKRELQLYLIHALLKNIFSSQGDSVLRNLREGIKDIIKSTEKEFNFSQLLEIKLPSNKSLKITDKDIEEFLSYKKGSNSFLILSLLYPNFKFGIVRFDQDHIHPDSKFSTAKLKQLNIPENKIKEWQEMKDGVPNLELLAIDLHKTKSDTPFKEWINGETKGIKNVSNQSDFKKTHYIPDVDLDFTNFKQFYEARKELLTQELKKLLSY